MISAEHAVQMAVNSAALLEHETDILTPTLSQRERECPQPLLTVIVPVYNEAGTIEVLLARVLESPLQTQIIVVDDGSTDVTGDKLTAWQSRVTVLTLEQNRGKGAAIRTALQQAQGVYTIIQDADLEYDPRDYERLLAPLLARQADAVYGSRRLRWSVFHVGVSMLNQLVRWLYGLRLSDEATCYKVFRTEDLRAMDLQCEGFEFCPEVTAKACRMGLSIRELPISYNARSVAEGKKIRWRDGWTAVKTLWRWRRWKAPETKYQPQRASARLRTAARRLAREL